MFPEASNVEQVNFLRQNRHDTRLRQKFLDENKALVLFLQDSPHPNLLLDDLLDRSVVRWTFR